LVNSSLHTHTPKRKRQLKKQKREEVVKKKGFFKFQILQTKKFLYSSMICVDFCEIKKPNCGGVNVVRPAAQREGGRESSVACQLSKGLIQLVANVLVPLLLCQQFIWSVC